uniref:Uncharacterized protein n=1 Tax=Arundo donax TaxID=35708 RepID=A0A0A9FY75_ARUDO
MKSHTIGNLRLVYKATYSHFTVSIGHISLDLQADFIKMMCSQVENI